MIRFNLLVSFILINSGFLWADQLRIPIISYHTHPPFLLAEGEGLTYDLAKYLTNESDGEYVFDIIPMSRPRVNNYIENDKTFILPWITPAWFDDSEELKYSWCDGVLLNDGYVIISDINRRIDYTGSSSIRGLRFGGIRGHNYIQTKALEAEGAITRLDSNNHIDNFKKIIFNKVDFCIISLSSVSFLLNENNMTEDLFVSIDKKNEYSRRLMMSNTDKTLNTFINKTIIKMGTDPEWQTIIGKYVGITDNE